MLERLKRWLQGPAPAAAPTPTLARPLGAAMPAPVPSRPADAARSAYGLRRPLLDEHGRVAACELRPPPRGIEGPAGGASAGAGNSAVAVARAVALLAAARMLLDRPRAPAVVLRLPAAVLAHANVRVAAPAGLWLAIESAPASTSGAAPALPAELAAAWRGHGVQLGVVDLPPEQGAGVDFALLRASAGGLDTLLLAAQRWQQARPGMPLVALDLESLDDAEQALRAGIALVGGRLDRGNGPMPPRPLQPAAHRVCVLLNDLALDRSTEEIAHRIRADVNLGYRLLRWVNSPALGLSRKLDDVAQAVQVLGRNELYRWLSVLLLDAGSGRPASTALQQVALAKARLLELLALKAPQAPDAAQPADPAATPGTLFTLGLMSMLEQLLQVPLATAVEPLRLSEPLREALLHRRGPLAQHLMLLEVLDGDDLDALIDLAPAWGGVATITQAAQQAWVWAETAAPG
jgi:EAL and modified HD-GYP domain-containing signal transduction protein